MVFCYQNCSDLLWEKKCYSDREKLLKFESEGYNGVNTLFHEYHRINEISKLPQKLFYFIV